MDESTEKVLRLLRAYGELEAEALREAWRRHHARCIGPSRLRALLLRGEWTPEERQHLKRCSYCRRFWQKVKARTWHPMMAQIWAHLQGRAEPSVAAHLEAHLERDRCGRCRWIQGLLAPWATLGRWPESPRRELPREAKGGMMRMLTFLTVHAAYPLEASEPWGVATRVPVALGSAEAREVTLEMPDVRVQWTSGSRRGTVRAEWYRLPYRGASVRFSMADLQGREIWGAEAPLRREGPLWVAEAAFPLPRRGTEVYLLTLVAPEGGRRRIFDA